MSALPITSHQGSYDYEIAEDTPRADMHTLSVFLLLTQPSAILLSTTW